MLNYNAQSLRLLWFNDAFTCALSHILIHITQLSKITLHNKSISVALSSVKGAVTVSRVTNPINWH